MSAETNQVTALEPAAAGQLPSQPEMGRDSQANDIISVQVREKLVATAGTCDPASRRDSTQPSRSDTPRAHGKRRAQTPSTGNSTPTLLKRVKYEPLASVPPIPPQLQGTITSHSGSSILLLDLVRSCPRGAIFFFFPKANKSALRQLTNFNLALPRFTESGFKVFGITPDKTGDVDAFNAEAQLDFDIILDQCSSIVGHFLVKKQSGGGICRSVFAVANDGIVVEGRKTTPTDSVSAAMAIIDMINAMAVVKEGILSGSTPVQPSLGLVPQISDMPTGSPPAQQPSSTGTADAASHDIASTSPPILVDQSDMNQLEKAGEAISQEVTVLAPPVIPAASDSDGVVLSQEERPKGPVDVSEPGAHKADLDGGSEVVTGSTATDLKDPAVASTVTCEVGSTGASGKDTGDTVSGMSPTESGASAGKPTKRSRHSVPVRPSPPEPYPEHSATAKPERRGDPGGNTQR